MTEPMPTLESFLEERRRKPRQVRLSISLDAGLVAWVRELAKAHDVPISTVVEYAIRLRMHNEKVEPGRRAPRR